MSFRLRPLGFAAAVLFVAGCEVVPLTPDSSNPTPVAADTQPPAAAIGLVTTLIQAAVENTIALGTDRNLTTRSLDDRAATNTERTVDLDDKYGGTVDKFRDANGFFTLTPKGEIFVPSWPTGSGGVKTVRLVITLPSQVGYTDPISGWTATLNGGSITADLDLNWTTSGATSTSPPTTVDMTAVITVPVTLPVSLSGRASKTGEVDKVWSLNGTRSLSLSIKRDPPQTTDQSTTTITAGTSTWTVKMDGTTTTVWNRSDKDTISVTFGSTSLFSGAISTLPTKLSVHSDPQTY